MTSAGRIRIAMQKSGRLADKSTALFQQCGLEFELRKDQLLHLCTNFPVELMLVRDDDIPEYVVDGVCQLGVVGMNVIEEKYLSVPGTDPGCLEVLMQLGFGAARLALAVPTDFVYESARSLTGLRIATSYPSCLRRFLATAGISAEIVELSGSVEIAPALKIADAICDLVSTGGTLRSNGLKEVQVLYHSQACLVRTGGPMEPAALSTLERLKQRIAGVLQASRSKYIMMNAPRSAVEQIRKIIPGMEEPSIIPLGVDGQRVAVHAVSREDVFWETMENLKSVGASSILVLPIEKVIA